MKEAIVLKSRREVGLMRDANRIVAETLALLKDMAVAGVTTEELDRAAERNAEKNRARPAFKGYRGFPASICVSINEQVVHGIPNRRVRLKDGDLVSLDFGVEYKGYFGDAAITVVVGQAGDEKERLVAATRESLERAIAACVVGNRVNDISAAVQDHAEACGFSVVRQFVGHGIGARLHEPPEVPNYRRAERTPKLMAGMTLAIEPMVNAGTFEVKVLRDGWTVVTADGRPSAHFEHTVLVTDDGPEVLSRL